MPRQGTYIIVASNSLWEAIVQQPVPPKDSRFPSPFSNAQFAEAALRRRFTNIEATRATKSATLRLRLGRKYRFVKQFQTHVGILDSRKYEIWEVL